MYDPFLSALLYGLLSSLISQKQMFDFEGVMTQLFVFQHILGSTFHQWDASACLVDRHRSSQKKISGGAEGFGQWFVVLLKFGFVSWLFLPFLPRKWRI